MAASKDGTSRLLEALYGTDRGQTRAILGGSDARMLHDAANEIDTLRARLARIEPVYEAAMRLCSNNGPERFTERVRAVEELTRACARAAREAEGSS